jgi:copper(I)-binding protein
MSARALRVTIALLVAACASTAAAAAEAKARVDGAWSRRAPMLDGSGNGAVYGTLVNGGGEADALVAATSDVAGMVEIHETYGESGMMMMRAIDRIGVAPGATVEMRPGGYHIMLLNLKRDLRPGQAVQLTFVFERAGPVAVQAEVR